MSHSACDSHTHNVSCPACFAAGPYAAFGVESEQEKLFQTRNDKHVFVRRHTLGLDADTWGRRGPSRVLALH